MVDEISKNIYLVNAPAGSGKTTRIRKMVERHLREQPDDNILCITYTNRAADELSKDIESDKVFFGTIHSFINHFICSFFSHKDIIDLYWNTYKDKIIERIDNIEKKDNVRESNERYIEKYGALDLATIYNNIQEITYNEAPYNSLYRGALSHDDLISFTKKVVDKFPVIRKKIADKYQLVFIDEYQDTSADVLHIFYAAMKNSTGEMYLLGDKMQQIYKTYDGSFEREFLTLNRSQNLTTNYRTTPYIVSILNRKQHADKKNVKKLLEKVVNAYENGDNIIKDFLNLVNECNLVDEEYIQEILGDEEYAEVLQVHLHEFHDLVKYLNDPHISTQHGVKGESHDTVLFIAANSSRDPFVNISKFFDLWSVYEVKLSEFESFYYSYKNMLKDIEGNIGKKVSDMKKKDYVENEENIIQKVNSFLAIYEGNAYYQALLKPKFEKFMKKRNVTEARACLKENLVYGALSAYKLFYVGCSRARKNLSVIINKQDILGFEDRLINKFESCGFKVIDYTKMKQ